MPGCAQLRSDAELLEAAGDGFDRERFLAGELSPMFFGSAINNFGLEAFLETFCELMPPPLARLSDQGPIEPTRDEFSGFVFKIQANMDKAHRDRIAFVRICSGRMVRGMKVHHVRSGKDVRLANPTQFLARERNLVEEGFAGDVVGIHDPGTFEIGDTLTGGSSFAFEGIPSFAPEHFTPPAPRRPHAPQAVRPGADRSWRRRAPSSSTGPRPAGPATWCWGRWGASSSRSPSTGCRPSTGWRWCWSPRPTSSPAGPRGPTDSRSTSTRWPPTVEGMVVLDVRDRPVVLFDREWALRSAERFHPEYVMAETASGVVVRAA